MRAMNRIMNPLAVLFAAVLAPWLCVAADAPVDVALCVDSAVAPEQLDTLRKAVDGLPEAAAETGLALRMGMVRYGQAGAAAQLETVPLSASAAPVSQQLVPPSAGEAQDTSGEGALYAAIVAALSQEDELGLGWREGAVRVVLVAAGRPPADPGPEGHTQKLAAERVRQQPGAVVLALVPDRFLATWTDDTAWAVSELAEDTGGETLSADSVPALKGELVTALAAASRRMQQVAWRADNEPLMLYGALGVQHAVIVLLALGLVLWALLRWRRKGAEERGG